MLNTPEKENQNEVVFFLGAGASIEAGIPDTHKFIYGKKDEDGVEGFLEWLKENNKEKELKILETILATFKQRNNCPIIDVELVLGTLNALNNKEKHDLVYFYNQESFQFKSEDEIRILKILESDLKEFIREKVIVKKDKINYLIPINLFDKPVNIFSVNYDTCIEMLCIKHKLKYTDGFDLYWNPESLEKKSDIKLFKLHGSILWYLTNWGNYVKLPIEMEKGNEIHLYSGETASPFILYPMGRKWEYTEPLVYLVSELQKNLKTAKLCIVVGYSFRDDDILRIFFESAKENENLTIILIAPNAGDIFKEKLKFRDKEKLIPSPIFDKVICLNYPFGSVLQDNYLHSIYKKISSQIKSLHFDAEIARREGEKGIREIFKNLVMNALEIGHVHLIERIFEKELGISPPDYGGTFSEDYRFRLYYSLAIFYLLNSDEKGKKYFEILRDNLKDIVDTGKLYFDLNIELGEAKTEKAKIEIKGKIDDLQKQHPDSQFHYWSARSGGLGNAIRLFYDFIQSQLKLNPGYDFTKLLRNVEGACKNLLDIYNIQYDSEKYKGSDKVDIGGASVEIKRKKDLEYGLINLIEKIIKLSDYWMKRMAQLIEELLLVISFEKRTADKRR